ncbi:class I SAM-dependent methyltransferase [Sphingomonas japonica]|uniref:SAM-dependent methyltransferase n=1 Tax=Sphingomonas japonica TaxID=511662 RepID=A0ABX0U4U3_9SPHN|nr:class I SAM-dependent methyltransferase [Sphingomonas japonica]NIJ24312.1 SAM-dependent methyltransferase [Sphingomonas japonica]
MDAAPPPDLFDRARRRLARDRAAPGFARADFLRQAMLDGVLDRLAMVTRTFGAVLDLGCTDASLPAPTDTLAGARIVRADPGFAFARAAGGIQCDEDHLPFADASFDLVLAVGTLDTVSDLPGALTLIRRALRPDGLFLGAFAGAGSLATLRSVLRDAEADRPAARLHPQVDVRSAGDLLMRAGFTLPVADLEPLRVRYANLFGLLDDLRAMAGTNLLAAPAPLSRATLARAATAFADRADPDGKTAEQFDLLFLTGWAPDPSQPKPARRGSGSTSLADALRVPKA